MCCVTNLRQIIIWENVMLTIVWLIFITMRDYHNTCFCFSTNYIFRFCLFKQKKQKLKIRLNTNLYRALLHQILNNIVNYHKCIYKYCKLIYKIILLFRKCISQQYLIYYLKSRFLIINTFSKRTHKHLSLMQALGCLFKNKYFMYKK